VRPERRVVLFVSERADFFGGGQRSLLDLARSLRGTRFEPMVLLPGDGPLAAALALDGIATRALPLPPLAGGALFAAPRALAALARLALRTGADVLHSDSPRAALYAGTAAGLLDRPHLWHVRASHPSSEFADAALLALCDLAVAVSQAAAGRSAALARSPRVRVVPTGVPSPACLPRAEARARLGLPAEGFVAGMVGRLEPDKGIEEGVEALPRLLAARRDARLVLLGDAPDGQAAWVRRLAAERGVSEAVLLPGAVAEAAPLLSAFDLLLHPSRHEALPRALLEALHAGVPIVAAAVGGVPEAIEDGVSGLLVPPRDGASLGAAAARLARDPALAASLTRAGRERARRLFSLDRMSGAVQGLYDEILGDAAGLGREAA
jgi:glycosyltransferase involved in cell wall biosynthesis